MKEGANEADKHSHKLTRANIHTCTTCGTLIATTFRETTTGELLMEELELDVKIVSSRISRLHSTIAHRKYAHSEEPSDAVIAAEDTCW